MQSTLSTRTGSVFQAASAARPCRQRLVAVQASSDPLLQKPAQRTEAAAAATAAPAAAHAESSGVTIEYQRQQAKAMRAYFQNLKLNETVEKSKVLGWTKKNEITNGRWVMMGILVGLMTEYATGVSFIDQLKLMASYMGLVDLD